MATIDNMRERLRPFGITFEKSLEDLIKGIRAANNDQEKLSSFLEQSIQECKTELKSADSDLKSTAVLKLAYLEMYGFDMSWCSFSILEVMASQKFQHKRIGYLAAIQILQRQNNDDALMLMTNQLKKDLNSVQYTETSLAISGIAAVVSKDLALDICDDLAKMLTHSKPLIRKKAVLAMYKIFLKNPNALRMYYDRIVDKLEDTDASVVSATVNVICELAHMNPSNYIDLAPRLYAMLKSSSNNWMIIRLLKLFSSLSLTEPRLKNKILPEIKDLMTSTKALSLTYECINSILNGNMLTADDIDTARLIVEKLLIFFESKDQNLKYVGLLAFIKTCKIHQNLIKQHSKIILTSIYDNDITIRETSLEIVNSLVGEHNIVAIVTRLTVQLLPYKEQQEHLDEINKRISEIDEDDADAENYQIGTSQQPIVVSEKYKYLLINKIIEICSMNNYENIPNFKWYLRVLDDLLKLNRDSKISNVDKMISEQLVDISIRVPSIRPELVKLCLELCGIPEKPEEEVMMFKNGLSNCIWIIGEYYDVYIQGDLESDSDSDTVSDNDVEQKYSALEIIEHIVKQKSLERLGFLNFDKTITTYIQSVAKIFSKFCISYGESEWSNSQFEFTKTLSIKIINWLANFENSPNFEIQERALSFIEILKLVEETLESEIESLKNSGEDTTSPPMFLTKGYNQLFSLTGIKPVSVTTQQKVAAPVDLNLEETLNQQAMFDFHNLYTRLKSEDLYVDFEEEEAEEKNDADYNAEGQISMENMPNTENTNKSNANDVDKAAVKQKDTHEDDPFYISVINDALDNSRIKSDDTDKKKKHKKPLKQKKYKKETILDLEDVDNDEAAFKKDDHVLKQSQFNADSLRLAAISLNNSEDTGTSESFPNEYQVNEGDAADFEGPKFDGIKIEASTIQPQIKKKPKKKVKRKVAVIE